MKTNTDCTLGEVPELPIPYKFSPHHCSFITFGLAPALTNSEKFHEIEFGSSLVQDDSVTEVIILPPAPHTHKKSCRTEMAGNMNLVAYFSHKGVLAWETSRFTQQRTLFLAL